MFLQTLSFSLVQESLVSEEIMHNLDTCEITVVGEELSPEQESLEVDMVRLQQKGMEMSSSNLGMIITGSSGSRSHACSATHTHAPLRASLRSCCEAQCLWDRQQHHGGSPVCTLCFIPYCGQ